MVKKGLRAERLAGRALVVTDEGAKTRVVYALARLTSTVTEQTPEGTVITERAAGIRGVLKAAGIAEFCGKTVTLQLGDGRSIRGVVSDEEGSFEASGDLFTSPSPDSL